jgi:hypothetical protein
MDFETPNTERTDGLFTWPETAGRLDIRLTILTKSVFRETADE